MKNQEDLKRDILLVQKDGEYTRKEVDRLATTVDSILPTVEKMFKAHKEESESRHNRLIGYLSVFIPIAIILASGFVAIYDRYISNEFANTKTVSQLSDRVLSVEDMLKVHKKINREE